MPYSFDLTRQPWIPCVMADGPHCELGIEDVLVRAHEIREISDDSPLATVAIHRLLLAILHRIFGPRDEDQWAEMWHAGRFDEKALREYLGDWRHRFDLFHPDRPFYQIPDPGPPDGESKARARWPAVRLQVETEREGNPTLFSHVHPHACPVLPASRAVRHLLVLHLFHYGGAAGYVDEDHEKHVSAGPLRSAAVVVVRGDTVFQTLLLNLVLYNPSQDWPYEGQSEADAPAWEQDAPARRERRDPLGYLDYLTWQSRRVFLQPDDVGGDPRVRGFVISDGLRFREFSPPRGEQMVAHRRAKKKFKPVGLRPDRAFWRDSLALFQAAKEDTRQQKYMRPPVMNFLAHLAADLGVPSPSQVLNVFVGGLYSRHADILFWRAERMPLPLRYLADESLTEVLAGGLQTAEQAGKALASRLRQIAYYIDSEHPSDRADAFPSLPYYWERLGRLFPRFLVDLARADDRDGVLRGWLGEVRLAAIDALDLTLRALPDSHEMLRLGAEARRQLRSRLSQIIPV